MADADGNYTFQIDGWRCLRGKFTFVGNPCDYHVKPTIALIEAIKKSNRKNGNEVGKQLFLIQEEFDRNTK